MQEYNQESLSLKFHCIFRLILRPRVSGYFWKRTFFIRFRLTSSRSRRFCSPKTDLFENAHFLSLLGSRPHVAGVFAHQKRIVLKTLSKVGFFKNSIFLLSCGRVKRIFLKTFTSEPREIWRSLVFRVIVKSRIWLNQLCLNRVMRAACRSYGCSFEIIRMMNVWLKLANSNNFDYMNWLFFVVFLVRRDFPRNKNAHFESRSPINVYALQGSHWAYQSLC